jgi:hypothetical protein
MSKTRGQIKTDIADNLTDLSINFYSDDDLNQSIQDAYDDIAILTQCVQKNVTLNWQGNLSYYNFKNLVSDYLGTIAIFNNVTNLWLFDHLSLRDFDRLRRDWEKWNGAPQFWAPSDPQRIAIAPKYAAVAPNGAFDPLSFSAAFYIGTVVNLGSFVLYYYAIAPTLTSDTDVFLIDDDKDQMVTQYVTGDLLEQAQEFQKAAEWMSQYYDNIQDYAVRVKARCKSDLLLRI